MRQVDKKYFGDVQSGRLNADDSPFAITTNEWVNAENVRSGTTDKGFTGIVESIGGNVELPKPLPFNTLDSVVIGTQTWTSKNLDVSTFANGETITQATSTEEWNSLLSSETPAWAYWNYDEANASLGKYYNTFAINSLKGLAPKGWHIPSSVELQKLYDFVAIDHPGETAYALREVGITHWNYNTGTDNYGFSMQGNTALESSSNLREYGYFPTSNNKVAYFVASNGIASITDAEIGWGYNVRLLRDKEYTEVKIGEQIWIGENYEGIRYRNGELIPQVTDSTAWAALTTGAWCWYNNDEATYGQYGRLYNWYAINDPRGFAPEGYSVPTDIDSTSDFAILSNYLGGNSVSGAKLKEAGTTHWISPNTGSTNSSGFTALPGSIRGQDGGFAVSIFGIGQYGVFGSLGKDSFNNAYKRELFNGDDYFGKATLGVKEGVSVRLLKNQYITIGSVEDTENNRILYFNYDTSPDRIDKITCLYTDTNTQYDVLYGSQINSNIITDITYNESYSTTTNITGVLNSLSFSDSSILPYLQVGYKIRINNTGFAGDYIISAVNSSTISVTLYEILPGIIITPTSASITIFSATTTYKSNGLNFSKNSLIHSAKMSGNILSWVEGTVNEPRKINIESAIKANYINFETTATPYSFPLDFSQITMIKRPPAFTPNFVKSYDSTFSNNFILNDSFEFAFQYEYYDSEVSVVSSYSQASKPNFPNDTYNCINVSMDYREVIPSTVKIVNLIARKGNGNPTGSDYAFIINTWDRSIELQNQQIENQNNSNSNFLSFTFYYDAIGTVLAVDDVTRQYDLVPIYSQTHEVSKSRYFLANNTLGYDTPKTTSLTVQLRGEVTLEGTSQTFNVLRFYCGNQIANETPPYIWSNAGYYIYLTYNQAVPGYYLINGTDNTTTTPSYALAQPNTLPSGSIAVSAITFKGANLSQVAVAVQPAGVSAANFKYTVNSGLTKVVTGLTNVYYNVLTHQSNYKLGIAFYDYAMRKCGVCAVNNDIQNLEVPMYRIDSRTFGIPVAYSVPFRSRQKITVSGLPDGNGEYTVISLGFATVSMTNLRTIVVGEDIASFADESVGTISYILSDIQLSTPTRDYAYTTAYSNGVWFLNEANRLEEIPEWACYYSIVKTLNLRTRLFFQSFSDSLCYATRNQDGVYTYNTIYQINQSFAIAINTGALVFSGLGYKYAEGDQCILWSENGSRYNLPVIGQDGNWILIQVKNIGNFNTTTNRRFKYEIYTPYKESDSEPYYEFGEMYQIINPGSQYRTYEQLLGVIPPDSYAFNRSYTNPTNITSSTTYISGAMSPNDIFWKRWDSDAGKVNVITRLGQSVKNTNIVWSDTYITGTQLNGSSTFRFGNDTYVPDDCGSINKLQLTSKVQNQGSVMLSLCSAETNSMYLGETQITDSTGAVQFFSGTQNVISTINTMKGNYGCIDPASVVQYRGNVYFLDASNGRWVQYSANGLDNISSVKMSRFWKNWCLKYLSMGKSEIEAFGDRPFVFATVDPSHDELLISIPKLSNTPPQGYLPDYPDMVYPFDILDYEGKTLVYKLGTVAVVQPHWQGAYTFTVENFITLQNRLFTFKNGFVYEHNQPTNIVDQNTFFGDYFPSKIMFTSNILPQLPKVYDNFVSESNLVPNFVYFYNNYPKLQMSDLDETSFVNLEGVWYAVILRNKRVDTGTSYTYDGLLTAEVMRNTNMYVLTEFSPTTEILQLRLLQLGTTISKGHTI